MKDPISTYFLSLGLAVAFGIGAMMLTVPHVQNSHVHGVSTDGATHVSCGDCTHRLQKKNEDDLTRLWNKAQVEHLPRLTAALRHRLAD